MKIEYVNVSTKEQLLSKQMKAIQEAICVQIHEEITNCGAKTARPVLDEIMRNLREDSTHQTLMSLLLSSPLSELKDKKQKINELYLIQSVIHFSIKALEEFLAGNLIAFDAQVGENLCQIRAYQIFYLANKWLNSFTLKAELIKEIESLKKVENYLDVIIDNWNETIRASSSYNKELDAPEKITIFMERHNLLISLKSDLIFVVVSFFLTYFNVRDDGIPIAINIEQIATEFNISKYRAKRLTHKYQQLICEMGSEFILNIFKEISSELDYETVLTHLYKIADEDRAVLPCYFVSEVIFKHCLLMNIPILLIVKCVDLKNKDKSDIIYFFLTSEMNKKKYHLADKGSSLSRFSIVVSGIMNKQNETTYEYIHRVMKDPIKLILANTANHPQYSGKKLEEFRQNPYVLIDPEKPSVNNYSEAFSLMKHYALNEGCSKENQSTFFLKHIYANNLNNEINRLYDIYPGYIIDAYDFINALKARKCTKLYVSF